MSDPVRVEVTVEVTNPGDADPKRVACRRVRQGLDLAEAIRGISDNFGHTKVKVVEED